MKKWVLLSLVLFSGSFWRPDADDIATDLAQIRVNIHYSRTHDADVYDTVDWWQDPWTTERLRAGDCEDLDAYAQEYLYQRHGIEVLLIVYKAPFGVHTCLYWDGYYFSAADSEWPFAVPIRTFPPKWPMLETYTRASIQHKFRGGNNGSQQLRLSLLQ